MSGCSCLLPPCLTHWFSGLPSSLTWRIFLLQTVRNVSDQIYFRYPKSGFNVQETADVMDFIKQPAHTRCFLNFLVSCNPGKICLSVRCVLPVCSWHVWATRVPVPGAVWVSSETAFSTSLAVQITVEQTQLNHTLCWSSKQPLLKTHTHTHNTHNDMGCDPVYCFFQ